MGKVLPDYLSQWTTDKVRSEGVTVLPNSRISSVTKGEGGQLKVQMESGNSISTDHIVLAVSDAGVLHLDIKILCLVRLVLSLTWLLLLLASWRLILYMEGSR